MFRDVSNTRFLARPRSLATASGLFTASLLCLGGGALLAVSLEGPLRIVLAALSFAGYLFFFAHALREFALPYVFVSGDPDPERAQARETSPPRPRKAYLTAA
jgi:hypothetical protein